jgi:hypothetical protein
LTIWVKTANCPPDFFIAIIAPKKFRRAGEPGIKVVAEWISPANGLRAAFTVEKVGCPPDMPALPGVFFPYLF